MKVALVEWRPSKSVQQWGTLGLQYIAAKLRESKINAEIFLLEGVDLERSYKTIVKSKPDVVGLTLFKENAGQILKLASMIKETYPEIITFLGGHTASLYGARLLIENPFVDVVTYGEGEETVLELCQRIDKKVELEGCRGIFYRNKGMITRNEDRPLIEDMDSLPFPVTDLLEKSDNSLVPYIFVTVSTSRGCLGRCEFCVEHRVSSTQGKKEWRGRSPKNIIEELLQVRKRFPNKRLVIRFVDGAIEDPNPVNKERLIELMNLIEQNKLDLTFSVLTRAESWKEEDLPFIKKMRKLGLFSVSIGLESGAQEALKIFGKLANVEDNRRTCRLFKEAGVYVYGFIIMFQPYSSIYELRETAEFIMEEGLASRTEYWIHSIYLYPDTKLYQRTAYDGLIIGTDETNYTYNYAFCHADTQRVYDITSILQNKNSYVNYQMSIDKIVQELELYRIWKTRYIELCRAEELVQAFSEIVNEISSRVGERQYELFTKILDKVEDKTLDRVKDKVLKEWDQMLDENYRILNQEYIRFQMKLGRSKIRII